MTNKEQQPEQISINLNDLSRAVKDFYTFGTFSSTLACSAITGIILFTIIAVIPPQNKIINAIICLIISYLVVRLYAYIIPEPPGFPHEGERELTREEHIYSVLNAFIVCATVLGFRSIL